MARAILVMMVVFIYQWLYFEYLSADATEEKCGPVNLNYSQVKQLQTMNPDVKYKAVVLTGELEPDSLFDSRDSVANALGRVEDLDRSCVYHNKFLLESGILGTNGSYQVKYPTLVYL